MALERPASSQRRLNAVHVALGVMPVKQQVIRWEDLSESCLGGQVCFVD